MAFRKIMSYVTRVAAPCAATLVIGGVLGLKWGASYEFFNSELKSTTQELVRTTQVLRKTTIERDNLRGLDTELRKAVFSEKLYGMMENNRVDLEALEAIKVGNDAKVDWLLRSRVAINLDYIEGVIDGSMLTTTDYQSLPEDLRKDLEKHFEVSTEMLYGNHTLEDEFVGPKLPEQLEGEKKIRAWLDQVFRQVEEDE